MTKPTPDTMTLEEAQRIVAEGCFPGEDPEGYLVWRKAKGFVEGFAAGAKEMRELAAKCSEQEANDCEYGGGRTRCADAIRALPLDPSSSVASYEKDLKEANNDAAALQKELTKEREAAAALATAMRSVSDESSDHLTRAFARRALAAFEKSSSRKTP